MNILVLNAGSSSLKFELFEMGAAGDTPGSEKSVASGAVERIGTPEARLVSTGASGASRQFGAVQVRTPGEAARAVLSSVMDDARSGGEIVRIDAVGHRIVHGGTRFTEPALIDADLLHEIDALSELAPLHNPAGIEGIRAAMHALPDVPSVAVFDTAFHHAMPKVAHTYALPSAETDRFQIRRYGFHGISYRYVASLAAELIAPPARLGRTVICHLGNGASVCALRNGVSIDTSMGFTPLEGLVMGTRAGDVDPGLVLHMIRVGKMTVDQVDEMLNRKSGLLGLSGRSGDVRDLETAAANGEDAAEFALECFAYRVRKYIGSYAAALEGLDCLIFTAGIGQHSAGMRARICSGLGFLGVDLDEARNRAVAGSEPADLGRGAAAVWVVPTHEERQIAREVHGLLGSAGGSR